MSAIIDAGIPAWANRGTRRGDPDTTHGVPCPKCGGDSRVIDSRPRDKAIRRRRVCDGCEHRYTTFEIVSDVDPASVAKLLKRRAGGLRELAAVLDQMAAGADAE